MTGTTRWRWGLIGLAVVVLWSGVAAAEERERGFIDLYGGLARVLESDAPGWQFSDLTNMVGVRAGVWIGPNWGLALRLWYQESDAKQFQIPASDLATLAGSLEVHARWRFDERWAVYASFGPALAVTTLDIELVPRLEDDARSVAAGMSGGVGLEARIWKRLRAFVEFQTSVLYPSFEFRDRTVTPRILTLHGLVGVRMPF
jgi:hypothetical protein